MLRQQVSSTVVILVIVIAIALVAGIYWVLGRPRGESIPGGVKPLPPQFKYKEGLPKESPTPP